MSNKQPEPTSSPSPHSSHRTRQGQWPPGVSGNPSGRPAGSRNKSTVLLEELLQARQEELIQKTIDLALQGDPVALRLCMERLLPVLKERRLDLPLPEVTDLPQAAAALSTILTGIGQGEITPGEGEVLASIVETQKRVLEAKRAERTRQELEQESHAMAAELDDRLGELARTAGPKPVPREPEPDQPASSQDLQ